MTKPGMTFEPAVRTAIPLCIGLFGEGGSGKTFSSLLLARGLVGPKGKIALVDTEHAKSKLFAELTPFDKIDLQAPYTVERFLEAIHGAVEQGYQCVIIDSLSSEWSGQGGLLDRADAQTWGSGKSMDGLAKWKKPKAEHNDLMHALQAHPIHVICTFRAKEINRQTKDPTTGKDVIVREGLAAETEKTTHYIFDFYGLIDPDHRFILRKDRTQQFTKQPFVITEDTGAKIRKWMETAAPIKNRGKAGGVYEDETVKQMLNELGLDESQHEAVITKNLGNLDPESGEALEKIIGMASAKLNERDAKEGGK